MGENYVMKKLVAPISAPMSLSLDAYRSTGGLVAGEVELPSTTDSAPAYSQGTVDQLMQMGFPEHRAVKAVVATGDRDADAAMMWLLDHMEDADIDDLIVSAASGGDVDEGMVGNLVDMGFSAGHAKQALKETVLMYSHVCLREATWNEQ
jgi:ubiquitin carboxyl-terminal hydrolase 5/13